MIWLIGFRAAGKSTLGRELAKNLGWAFIDADEELERRLGFSILELVAQKGEPAFRSREAELLRELAQGSTNRVVATGGGFVEWPDSRKIVAVAPGVKAWLDVPESVLWERLEKAPERRKISNLNTREAMQVLLEKRRVFYKEIATFTVKSQDISEALALLQSLGGGL